VPFIERLQCIGNITETLLVHGHFVNAAYEVDVFMSTHAVQPVDSSIAALNLSSSMQDDDPRWTLVLRITESQQFAKSPLLSQFLVFICERSLLDAEGELTEHNIGVTVFKRRPGYKTSEDNIVRNYARQLRQRLDQYFEGPGQNEALRITIPRGYNPVFESVEVTPGEQPTPETSFCELPRTAQPADVGLRSREISQAEGSPNKSRFGLLAVLVSVLLIGAGWLGTRFKAPSMDGKSSVAHALWSQLFSDDSTSYIVTEDAGLQVLQDITGRQSTLPEYIDGTYLGQFAEGQSQESIRLHRISGERLTNTPDTDIVTEMVALPEAQHKQVFVRNARLLSLKDLKQGNVVLLGSNFANPWVSVFEPQMNFRLQYDLVKNQSRILNVNPRPGERSVYQDTGTTPPYATYAVIAFLPNLTHSGWILIVEGLTMTGTEAGSEFLLDDDPNIFFMKARNTKGELRPFEVLLETMNLSSQSVSAKIIAQRIY
jgi:hypothetical protein